MKLTEEVLLAQRNDGKFLRLREDINTTSYDYVDQPELAKRITPWDKTEFKKPKPAPYYFENSDRARDFWLKDCVMVPYEITTDVIAKKI